LIVEEHQTVRNTVGLFDISHGIHHAPKHENWLNMAEIGLSVLARQCPDRRMETKR